MTNKAIVVNTETGETYERDLTEIELADIAIRKQQADQLDKQIAEASAKRQALLDKLGITEEEAILLMGGI